MKEREFSFRIRELTSVVQKRFSFPENTVELYAEKVATRGLCAIAQVYIFDFIDIMKKKNAQNYFHILIPEFFFPNRQIAFRPNPFVTS